MPCFQGRRLAYVFIFLATVACVPAAQAEFYLIDPRKHTDPFFNEVFFHAKQQKVFTAISKLSTLHSSPRFAQVGADAELALAQLYMAYGLHEEATRLLSKLVFRDVDPDSRDMAWMLLAKLQYRKGLFFEAEQSLSKIQKTFSWQLQEERDNLRAFLLLQQKRYRQAITVLKNVQSSSVWSQYARYNLGIALLNEGRKDEGIEVLRSVDALAGKDKELVALKEQALLLLGDLYLREEDPKAAVSYYEQVRLAGPFSNKALLGIGWAYYMLRDYEGAILPWMALFERSAGDSAVQEGVLAVPYAYSKLGDYQQAQRYYQLALSMYQLEQGRIQVAVESVQSGHMVETLLAAGKTGETGWSWQLESLPGLQEAGYLANSFANNEFVGLMRSYQDLVLLRDKLDEAQIKLNAFAGLLEQRKNLFEKRLPQVKQIYRSANLSEWRKKQRKLETILKTADERQQLSVLASSKEKENLERLNRIEKRFNKLPVSVETEQLREKYRFVKGLATWELNTEFKQRVFVLKKLLIELDDAITEISEKKMVFTRVQKVALNSFKRHQEKFTKILNSMGSMQKQVHELLAEVKQQLEGKALHVLNENKKRLNEYVGQASFASAQIFDLQNSAGEKR